jgi:hypothetical protein
MGPSSFTSHPREGVLWIFIALKNPSPWPGSNPQPLDPIASTLTTTPPRRPVASTRTVCSSGAATYFYNSEQNSYNSAVY